MHNRGQAMKIRSLYVEITNRCNLKCRSCYNESWRQSKRDLEPALLSRLIDTYMEFGLDQVVLSGGEPTLHPEFDEYMKLVQKYPDINFAIITNGVNKNEKLFSYYSRCKNIKIQVSLDGADEETNSLLRGTGNFEPAINTLKELVCIDTTFRQEDGGDFVRRPIGRMILSKFNVDSIEKYFKLAMNLGIGVTFGFVVKQGEAIKDWETKNLSVTEKINAMLKIRKLNNEYGIKTEIPTYAMVCPIEDKTKPSSILIKTDGSIQPCQMLYDETFCLGNIKTSKIIDIVNSMDRIRNIILERRNIDFGCDRCICRSICGRGCMGVEMQPGGSYQNSVDADCCELRRLQLIRFMLPQITDAVNKNACSEV